MNIVIWIGLIFFLTKIVDSETSSTHQPCLDCNVYDVTGTDFLNTQTTKLCLLARLNVSIQFSYRSDQGTLTKTIFIPSNASNERSICNYDFVSILQLDFGTISFSLNFRRNTVEAVATDIGYCQGCENGNWWLEMIYVNVSDASKIFSQAPPSRIVSNVSGNGVSAVAGGLITGVSLQRGYRCANNILEGDLNVTKAIDLTNKSSRADKWNIKIYFHKVNIQPFLVTNDIVKDPLLCKDFTLFLIFIILIPLLYFSIFIAYYRWKETFGLIKLRSRRPLISFTKNKGNKMLLASGTDQNPSSQVASEYHNAGNIAMTCTTSEGKETDVLKSGTKC